MVSRPLISFVSYWKVATNTEKRDNRQTMAATTTAVLIRNTRDTSRRIPDISRENAITVRNRDIAVTTTSEAAVGRAKVGAIPSAAVYREWRDAT